MIGKKEELPVAAEYDKNAHVVEVELKLRDFSDISLI